MKYNPDIHHRRSIRLKGYDSSQDGLYFITICTHQRQHLFGHITHGLMHLNSLGEIIHSEWQKTAQMRAHIELHEFIIMPNHMHAILQLVRADCIRPTQINSLPPIAPLSLNDDRVDLGLIDDRVDLGRMQSAPTIAPLSLNDDRVDLGLIDDRVDLGRMQSAPTVGDIVRGFKSAATKRVNELRNTPGLPVWHRNYYEHIIRDESAYWKISQYIQTNPQRWQEDRFRS